MINTFTKIFLSLFTEKLQSQVREILGRFFLILSSYTHITKEKRNEKKNTHLMEIKPHFSNVYDDISC